MFIFSDSKATPSALSATSHFTVFKLGQDTPVIGKYKVEKLYFIGYDNDSPTYLPKL